MALSSMHRVDVIRELELHWGEEAPKSYTVDMLKSVLKELRKEAAPPKSKAFPNKKVELIQLAQAEDVTILVTDTNAEIKRKIASKRDCLEGDFYQHKEDSTIYSIGTHKGKTFGELNMNETHYCKWVLMEWGNHGNDWHPQLQALAEYLLAKATHVPMKMEPTKSKKVPSSSHQEFDVTKGSANQIEMNKMWIKMQVLSEQLEAYKDGYLVAGTPSSGSLESPDSPMTGEMKRNRTFDPSTLQPAEKDLMKNFAGMTEMQMKETFATLTKEDKAKMIAWLG